MKRLETEIEETLYNSFEQLCKEQDISMRKKTRQLIARFVLLSMAKTKKIKK